MYILLCLKVESAIFVKVVRARANRNGRTLNWYALLSNANLRKGLWWCTGNKCPLDQGFSKWYERMLQMSGFIYYTLGVSRYTSIDNNSTMFLKKNRVYLKKITHFLTFSLILQIISKVTDHYLLAEKHFDWINDDNRDIALKYDLIVHAFREFQACWPKNKKILRL